VVIELSLSSSEQIGIDGTGGQEWHAQGTQAESTELGHLGGASADVHFISVPVSVKDSASGAGRAGAQV
jgi:hypothetical protein